MVDCLFEPRTHGRRLRGDYLSAIGHVAFPQPLLAALLSGARPLETKAGEIHLRLRYARVGSSQLAQHGVNAILTREGCRATHKKPRQDPPGLP
jgi:hypothetical protein